MRHRIEYWLTLLLVLVIRLLRWPTALKLGDVCGALIFEVLRIRRNVALDNLRHAFPDNSDEELIAIARRAYQNFVKMTIEYFRFPDLTPKKVMQIVEFESVELLEWIIANGRGAMCIAGHFGNWELMGAAIRAAGYPMTFLVGEQHNRRIDDMMNRNRQLVGVELIHMGVAVRGVIKALRSNKMIALLSDQDAGRDGVFVDYFGRPASTPKGPAVFALKTGSPVMFGSAVRLKDGRHRLYFDLVDEGRVGALSDENIEVITQAYTSVLERYVRQYPDHWFWMHRRWKTLKPAEK